LKIPRNLNGTDLAEHLVRHWNYRRVKQTGSHIKLRTDFPHGQTATIPVHKPLNLFTLAGILKEVASHKGVTVEEILHDL
jgi:predicted RNA binding protein YcfA (HicA-like mRNA interferase family)